MGYHNNNNISSSTLDKKFNPIAADFRTIDDEWIEYGWCKTYINVERNGRWRRGLDSIILYRQSEINDNVFEPHMIVDKYHMLFPNPEIDKRLRDLQQRGKLQILQQSRQIQGSYEMIWLVHPSGQEELRKPIKIGNKDFYMGVVIRNIEASVSGAISVYPMLYEKIGQHTIMPFIFSNYKMKGVRISKDPQLYERSVSALEDQIVRCTRKTLIYVDLLKEATKHMISEELVASVLKHYMTINDDYLPYYIYVTRSMREQALDIQIVEEGKKKTLFDVCYDIADQIWQYRQKRLNNAVPGVSRLTNGLIVTIDGMNVAKSVAVPTDEDLEAQMESDANAMEEMHEQGKKLGIYKSSKEEEDDTK